MSCDLHLTRDEWDRIAADGGGVLFRPGHVFQSAKAASETPDNPYESRPPAEFVEAAKPCQWGCEQHDRERHADDGRRHDSCPRCVLRRRGMPCPIRCLDGKRRIAVVVPCTHGSCRRIGIQNECPVRISVGHVVVEWGPDPIVKYGEHATVGSYVVVLVEPGSRNAFRVENHRLPIEQHEFTLSPDVDPATLVGQYALGIKVVEP